MCTLRGGGSFLSRCRLGKNEPEEFSEAPREVSAKFRLRSGFVPEAGVPDEPSPTPENDAEPSKDSEPPLRPRKRCESCCGALLAGEAEEDAREEEEEEED
eukprot:RCo021816